MPGNPTATNAAGPARASGGEADAARNGRVGTPAERENTMSGSRAVGKAVEAAPSASAAPGGTARAAIPDAAERHGGKAVAGRAAVPDGSMLATGPEVHHA
jgi:hypothetical protein